MTEALQILGAGFGLLSLMLTLVGLAARFVMLPWLKDKLVMPGLERLDTIQEDMRAMTRAYDGHLEWSQNEVDRLWDAIKDLRGGRGSDAAT